MRVMVLWMLLLLAITASASAYGRSVEDLSGVFSVEKTIRLGSSSECFAPTGSSDPLSPPAAMTYDQTSPLAGFDFEPKAVLASGPKAINLTLHIIDHQSSPWICAAYFQSPSGDQEAVAIFDAENITSSGPEGEVYAAQMLLPQESERGNWVLENLTLVDRLGNRKVLQRMDLLRQGMPVQLQVT